MISKKTAKHPLTLAFLLFLASTAPFAAASALEDGPDGTNTEIIVGVQDPDDGGKVQAFNSENQKLWQFKGAETYFDVTLLESGYVLTSYANESVQDCQKFPSPCGETGIQIINPHAEDGPTKVWQWEMELRDKFNSEIHDVMPVEGGFIAVDMEYERLIFIPKDAKDGVSTVLWRASKFYDAPEDATEEDWLHINDVDRISENEYLISVRNENQLLVINTTQGKATQVINKERDKDILSRQHNPQWLSEDRILVADSHNLRIVELEKQDGEWVPVWGIDKAQGEQFRWPRDADRLPNGNTLITDSRNHRVVEVNAQGETVNSWDVGFLPYEADAMSVGETVGGQSYPANEVADPRENGVMGKIVNAVQHVESIPVWVKPIHGWLFLVILALFIAGISIETIRAVRYVRS